MTISDSRYGGEVISRKGKVFKFDDIHCIKSFIHSAMIDTSGARIYFVDFAGDHSLIQSGKSVLFESVDIHAPMNGNVVAFNNPESIKITGKKGIIKTWDDLK